MDYIIAISGRCGSTFLQILLHNNGLGHPEEYFNPSEGHQFSEAIKQGIYTEQYSNDVRSRYTLNGLLGITLHPIHIDYMINNININNDNILEYLFDHPRFIRLRRSDLLRQSISWWKAKNTNDWFKLKSSNKNEQKKIEFNIEAIDQEIRNVLAWESYWDNFFEMRKVSPLELTYENLVANPQQTIKQISTFLNRPVPQTINSDAYIEKQSDKNTEEIIKRYLSAKSSLPVQAASSAPNQTVSLIDTLKKKVLQHRW